MSDEGYVGFMLGVDQMKKKLTEKDREIERLKEKNEELFGYVKRFQETLAEVAHLAIDAEQEQIFKKCRDALRDVYLEEIFRDKFDKILHAPDSTKGVEK